MKMWCSDGHTPIVLMSQGVDCQSSVECLVAMIRLFAAPIPQCTTQAGDPTLYLCGRIVSVVVWHSVKSGLGLEVTRHDLDFEVDKKWWQSDVVVKISFEP